jgi:hypothetical protein
MINMDEPQKPKLDATKLEKIISTLGLSNLQMDVLSKLVDDSDFLGYVRVESGPRFFSPTNPLVSMRIMTCLKSKGHAKSWYEVTSSIDNHYKEYGVPIKRSYTPEFTNRLTIFGKDDEEVYVFTDFSSWQLNDAKYLIRS